MSTLPFLPSQQPDSAICGKLTHAGTMSVGCDHLVTGVFITIPIEVLRAVKHLPIYRDVSVVVTQAGQPTPAPNPRDEPLIDAIATIIQMGHIEGKTSHEIAREIVARKGGA